jgi:ubiquinone biosynthesis monooxygenase Coq6
VTNTYVFVGIGVSDHLAPGRANPYSDMRVWDGVTDAQIHFDATTLPDTVTDDYTIATMIENTHLQHALLKRLEQCRQEGAQVDILQKARVAAIQQGDKDGLDWPKVQLENGTILNARLLVGLFSFSLIPK